MPIAAALPYIVAAASTYSSISQAQSAKKAAGQAGQSSQVDVNDLNQQAKAIATQNALDSAELERQMTPQVPQIRSAAYDAILHGIGPNASETQAQDLLKAGLGQSSRTPLLEAAIAKARADLGLGGQLSIDQQNLVTRQGLAKAGTVGGGAGLGLGRDVVARDLGLSSLAIEQQRLQTASTLGGMEQKGAQFDSNNLLNQIQMLKSISDGQFGRGMTAGAFGESIRQPIIGLDPSSVANLAVGNSNARSAAFSNQADIAGASANNWLKLLGTAISTYGNRGTGPASSTPYTYTGTQGGMSGQDLPGGS